MREKDKYSDFFPEEIEEMIEKFRSVKDPAGFLLCRLSFVDIGGRDAE